MDLDFTDDELLRYSRHILLPEIGAIGQAKLRQSRVLVVGAGGLGSPATLYLAAAGIGTLGIADPDQVELSNLQRQIAHTTARLGHNKARSAAEAAQAINPDTRIETHPVAIGPDNAAALIATYDLVADGSDNFATRYLLGDTCFRLRKTLVSAAVLRFEGQLATFRPDGPCYRCFAPSPPPPGFAPPCAEAGILGAVTGVLGALQVVEIVKELLGLGTSLAGRLLIWDALDARVRTLRLERDPHCPLCGTAERETAPIV